MLLLTLLLPLVLACTGRATMVFQGQTHIVASVLHLAIALLVGVRLREVVASLLHAASPEMSAPGGALWAVAWPILTPS